MSMMSGGIASPMVKANKENLSMLSKKRLHEKFDTLVSKSKGRGIRVVKASPHYLEELTKSLQRESKRTAKKVRTTLIGCGIFLIVMMVLTFTLHIF